MTWPDEDTRPREPRDAPKYDSALKHLLYDEPELMAACVRAGFVLIRDAAKPTGEELVANHGFTERDVKNLHDAFVGHPAYEFPIEHGHGFARLVLFHMRDLEGGEGDPDRAWDRLGELGAQPKKPPRRKRLRRADD